MDFEGCAGLVVRRLSRQQAHSCTSPTQEPDEDEATGSRGGELLAAQCALADGAAELLRVGAAHGEGLWFRVQGHSHL